MTVITTTEALDAACKRLSREVYITVDTEFIRESTFWPQLCLFQMASRDEALAVDPLADGIDLTSLFELMADETTLKVFHAGRQDIEILYNLAGAVPHPIFDTQLAAMVCGFGDSVGYETLVTTLLKKQLDKASRFTDWARRPLTDRQLSYALDDVIYLHDIYEKLRDQLEETNRAHWLDREMELLAAPATYDVPLEDAWKRIKARSNDPRFLGILQEVAGWRENEARTRDMPRNRVLRDESLLEIAAHPPKRPEDLNRMRSISQGFSQSRSGKSLLEAVERGKNRPEDTLPRVPRKKSLPRGIGPLVDLLKVLLKMKCETFDVAQKLIANVADLERIAADDYDDVPAMTGWRFEVFGEDALKLKNGELALAAKGRKIDLVRLND
jgi:ribonuclease D